MIIPQADRTNPQSRQGRYAGPQLGTILTMFTLQSVAWSGLCSTLVAAVHTYLLIASSTFDLSVPVSQTYRFSFAAVSLCSSAHHIPSSPSPTMSPPHTSFTTRRQSATSAPHSPSQDSAAEQYTLAAMNRIYSAMTQLTLNTSLSPPSTTRTQAALASV